MQTAKQQAAALIPCPPDDVASRKSSNGSQQRLYVLEHIRAGIAELDAGEGVPHDEVRAEFARWLDG